MNFSALLVSETVAIFDFTKVVYLTSLDSFLPLPVYKHFSDGCLKFRRAVYLMATTAVNA